MFPRDFAFEKIQTPAYIVDEKKLITNLECLLEIQEKSNSKILLAQKAFSMYALYPLIAKYLAGTAASGLHEAKLGRLEMNKEVHTFSPAFKQEEFTEIVQLSDHLIFNSFNQWLHFKPWIDQHQPACSFGLRLNPNYSEMETELYSACSGNSRLGVTHPQFQADKIEGLEGFHFHCLCEQGAEALIRTLKVFEQQFSDYLQAPQIKWLNLGGGHHITKKDYNRPLLIEHLLRLQNTYKLKIYLEPGEAIALDAGYLATRVLDLVQNKTAIAILDTSATCHMPDVLEMPYRPKVWLKNKDHWDEGLLPGDKPYSIQLSGPTCLAGDIIGDYAFSRPLKTDDILLFGDMAIYTMVKTNTFNGMPLPDNAILRVDNNYDVIKHFDYEDFKRKL